MPKQCKADGCTNNVFSHGYCQRHGYMWKKPTPLKRTAIKQSNKLSNKLDNVSSKVGKKLDNSLHKKRYTKSVKRTSSKRSQETALYEQAKINVRKKLQEKAKWKCFFSNIELEDSFNEFHHLMDKHGSLLYDENNIRPAMRSFHNDYHQKTIGYLLEQKWYQDFLVRIKDEFPEVWEKEQRRISKR